MECTVHIQRMAFMAVTGGAGQSVSPRFHSKREVATAASAQLNGQPTQKVSSNGQPGQMHCQWAESGASGSNCKRTSAKMADHTNFCRLGLKQTPDQHEEIGLES
jgi:hypothetical protein